MDTNEYGQPIGFPVVDWAGAGAPDRSPMSGSFAYLEGVTDTGVCAALFDAYKTDVNGLNWTYLPYGPFDQLADFTSLFEQACFQGDPLFHVIRRQPVRCGMAFD